MRSLCSTVSVIGALTIGSQPARAQQSDTLSPAQRAGLALARLGGGQRVRIRASGVGLVEGRVVSSWPNLLTLRTADGSTIEVPAPGVDSLWVRSTRAGKGALIGGAVAGIGLAVFLASHANQDNPYNARNTAAGALGLVGGGAFGALVGATIGAGSPKWELRVP